MTKTSAYHSVYWSSPARLLSDSKILCMRAQAEMTSIILVSNSASYIALAGYPASLWFPISTHSMTYAPTSSLPPYLPPCLEFKKWDIKKCPLWWWGGGHFYRFEPLTDISTHACQIRSQSDGRVGKRGETYRQIATHTHKGTLQPLTVHRR